MVVAFFDRSMSQAVRQLLVIVQEGRRLVCPPEAEDAKTIDFPFALLDRFEGQRTAAEFRDQLVKLIVQRVERVRMAGVDRFLLLVQVLLEDI